MALTATASTSVIACGGHKEQSINKKLDEQVIQDLELTNINLTMIITQKNEDIFKMEKLLNLDNTAVSQASEEFLINTLKLSKDNKGKFKRNDVINILCVPNQIKPTFVKKQNDRNYEFTDGNFKIQFIKIHKNGSIEVLGNYWVNLKGSILDIYSILNSFKLNIYNFNPIFNFEPKKDNKQPSNNIDLYEYLRTDDDIYNKLDLLNNIINTSDKIRIIVTGRNITPSQKENYEFGSLLMLNLLWNVNKLLYWWTL